MHSSYKLVSTFSCVPIYLKDGKELELIEVTVQMFRSPSGAYEAKVRMDPKLAYPPSLGPFIFPNANGIEISPTELDTGAHPIVYSMHCEELDLVICVTPKGGDKMCLKIGPGLIESSVSVDLYATGSWKISHDTSSEAK